MSECKVVLLSDRAVVRVTGEAARNFLQGLITNHIDQAKPGSAIHTGLLTPQGKILVDFFVLPVGDGFLLELAKAKLADLIQRLTVYKLRTQVAFAEEPSLRVAASWGSTPLLPEGAIAFADPRLPELGLRILLPANADISGLGCALASEDEYHARRIALGVPEGGRDYTFGDAFPHEAMFDQLNGVDFKKGCFVGQEVVSRMEHRGTARKRIVGVEGEGPVAAARHGDRGGQHAHRHAWLGRRQLWACASPSRPRRRGEGRGHASPCRRGDRRRPHSRLGALQDARACRHMSKAQATRCPWAGSDPLYVAYHDEEWGVPKTDARALFEKLVLEGFQAGLSWITILRKREAFRAAFDNFDAEKMARYGQRKVASLLKDEGIVRHRGKIEAAISNAKAFIELESGPGFSQFLWGFVDGKPKQNAYRQMSDMPAVTPESTAMAKALKSNGFRFCGPTTLHAFMQSVGMVNDHLTTCFRHAECAKLGKAQPRPRGSMLRG